MNSQCEWNNSKVVTMHSVTYTVQLSKLNIFNKKNSIFSKKNKNRNTNRNLEETPVIVIRKRIH